MSKFYCDDCECAIDARESPRDGWRVDGRTLCTDCYLDAIRIDDADDDTDNADDTVDELVQQMIRSAEVTARDRTRREEREARDRAFRAQHGYYSNSVRAFMLAYPDEVTEKTSKRGVRGVEFVLNGSKRFYPLASVNNAQLHEWDGVAA